MPYNLTEHIFFSFIDETTVGMDLVTVMFLYLHYLICFCIKSCELLDEDQFKAAQSCFIQPKEIYYRMWYKARK